MESLTLLQGESFGVASYLSRAPLHARLARVAFLWSMSCLLKLQVDEAYVLRLSLCKEWLEVHLETMVGDCNDLVRSSFIGI